MGEHCPVLGDSLLNKVVKYAEDIIDYRPTLVRACSGTSGSQEPVAEFNTPRPEAITKTIMGATYLGLPFLAHQICLAMCPT